MYTHLEKCNFPKVTINRFCGLGRSLRMLILLPPREKKISPMDLYFTWIVQWPDCVTSLSRKSLIWILYLRNQTLPERLTAARPIYVFRVVSPGGPTQFQFQTDRRETDLLATYSTPPKRALFRVSWIWDHTSGSDFFSFQKLLTHACHGGKIFSEILIEIFFCSRKRRFLSHF